MKKTLTYLFEHNTLSREEAKKIMLGIGEGKYNETEISALITVYLMRSITIEELQGFRDGLLQMAIPLNLEADDLTDIVGTGGDGKNTFNISTLSCFIVAGAGKKVAKHGNYGSSSVSGSSNVMECLGYQFKNNAQALQNELDRSNICFLHAPVFHPALKQVASLRKNLGMRSFFNMLGPLVNPANPNRQLVGVYNQEMGRNYTYLLQNEKTDFCIVHSFDGYDEISLTGDARVITNKGEKVWSAVELGKRTVSPADIFGGNTIEEASNIFLKILKGEGSWAQNAVVLANAALALNLGKPEQEYETAYQQAVESLESGKAYTTLKNLINA